MNQQNWHDLIENGFGFLSFIGIGIVVWLMTRSEK